MIFKLNIPNYEKFLFIYFKKTQTQDIKKEINKIGSLRCERGLVVSCKVGGGPAQRSDS